jgi:hypothetical protein
MLERIQAAQQAVHHAIQVIQVPFSSQAAVPKRASVGFVVDHI